MEVGDNVKETADQGFRKGCALIRGNLHVDPTAGSDEDWADNYAAALWLEDMRTYRLGKLLERLFSSERR